MSNSCSDSPRKDAAKTIYLEHEGSSFFMARTGIYETYREMNVDRSQEKEWARERIVELLAMPISPKTLIDGSYGSLIELIKNSEDLQGLESLIDKIEVLDGDLDTISLLLIAESMLRLLHAAKHNRILYDKRLIAREKRIAARLLARASEMKISIAPFYHEAKYLKHFLSDKDVIERINCDMRELDGYEDTI